MTNDNNLSVSRIEERKSLQLPRREASGVSPRRLHRKTFRPFFFVGNRVILQEKFVGFSSFLWQ